MATVRYLVDDVARCVAFYVDALGFEEIERYGPAMAIVRRGRPRSVARRPDQLGGAPDARRATARARAGGTGIVLTTDDLAAHVERLRAGGAVFRNDIVEGPGGRQILVEDPAGNPIELFEPA